MLTVRLGQLSQGMIASEKELGLSEDTLVIITSDHGEEFFEHDCKTHRKQLYRESVHVPLLMRWPGRLSRSMDGTQLKNSERRLESSSTG